MKTHGFSTRHTQTGHSVTVGIFPNLTLYNCTLYGSDGMTRREKILQHEKAYQTYLFVFVRDWQLKTELHILTEWLYHYFLSKNRSVRAREGRLLHPRARHTAYTTVTMMSEPD